VALPVVPSPEIQDFRTKSYSLIKYWCTPYPDQLQLSMGLGNSLQLRMSTKCRESTRTGTAKARANKCREFTHKGPRASTTRSCRHVPANELGVGIRSYFTYRSVQISKPCSRDLMFQNLILHTGLCGMRFITQPSCVVDFWLIEICQAEMICIGGVPVLKRQFGGAGP